jgi:hypothetical protein
LQTQVSEYYGNGQMAVVQEGDMNWKAGDRAIIDCHPHACAPDCEKYAGTECTLVRFMGGVERGGRFCRNAWLTDAGVAVAEAVLRKPPYDGNEKTSWSDCVFKPKELVLVESQKAQREMG